MVLRIFRQPSKAPPLPVHPHPNALPRIPHPLNIQPTPPQHPNNLDPDPFITLTIPTTRATTNALTATAPPTTTVVTATISPATNVSTANATSAVIAPSAIPALSAKPALNAVPAPSVTPAHSAIPTLSAKPAHGAVPTLSTFTTPNAKPALSTVNALNALKIIRSEGEIDTPTLNRKLSILLVVEDVSPGPREPLELPPDLPKPTGQAAGVVLPRQDPRHGQVRHGQAQPVAVSERRPVGLRSEMSGELLNGDLPDGLLKKLRVLDLVVPGLDDALDDLLEVATPDGHRHPNLVGDLLQVRCVNQLPPVDVHGRSLCQP